MTKEFRTIKTEIRLPYELAYGETWTRFFEGLSEKKIYGNTCPKCSRILVPARAFCPRCFVDMGKWKEVSQEGTVIAWCYTNYKYYGMPTEPPFIGALIRLNGTDVNFLHLLGGFDLSNFDEAKKIVKSGMKVKAEWSDDRKAHIMDIKYFKPA